MDALTQVLIGLLVASSILTGAAGDPGADTVDVVVETPAVASVSVAQVQGHTTYAVLEVALEP